MTRSEARKKVQSLVDKISSKHGALAWLSIASEKGTVRFIIVNSIEGGSKSAAKKEIRAWAKKNKVKLKWMNPAKPQKRSKKTPQIPPPFKKLTDRKIEKLKGVFRVHDDTRENPDPADCHRCGMEYKDLKTGLDFQAVKDMLWIQDSNPEYWRYRRRGSVLGLWYEIKRGMWADHLAMCGGKPITEAQYLDHLEAVEEY